MEFRILDEIIDFNPTETLKKGTLSKKISMNQLDAFSKYINSFEIENYSGGMKFRNGDTLLARITPCLQNGKTSKVTILNDNEVGFGSTEYIVMRKKEKLSDEDFIYYLAISPKFRNIAIKSMTGTSGRQRVQLDVLKNTKIMLPAYNEQIKIGKILSKIDAKINLNNKINNNLHELSENIFNVIYQSGKRCKLGNLISNISTGSRPKGGAQKKGVPSIGAEKVERFGIYSYTSEKYISDEFFHRLKNGVVRSGDVLLYKDGAYTGKVSMSLNNFPYEKCAINEHVFILNTKNNWAKFYLYFILNNYENKTKLFTMANAKAAQPGLNQVELKSLDIKLASKDNILAFEKRVEPLMNQIACNAKENRKLEQLRDTLLPQLMDGKIDLEGIDKI